MREQYENIRRAGGDLFVVFPSDTALVQEFMEAFGPLPFPVYTDPGRELYYDMGHVTMPKLKMLALVGAGALSGRLGPFLPKEETQRQVVMKSMKTQDVYIQGGTWIFDTSLQPIWRHIDPSPDKHASPEKIAEVFRQHVFAGR
ncbi:AhpC/TSA family protein [Alkalicoccus chagannorensis]|uniref:AhpC/TSA family protein n=1 Tax=Alkalicoccus chagannorensis TaxID=427072 RepID=UPI0004232ADE